MKMWGLIGWLVGILCGLLIALFLITTSTTEWIDVESMGQILCEEYDLDYSHHEFEVDTPPYVPTIYCEDQDETKLLDGIVKQKTMWDE